MIQTLQIFSALLVIILILPQNPPRQKVETWFWETGLFTNYQEAKRVIKLLTILTTIFFFMLTLALHKV
uniref:Hypothetical chloroplast RF47 n=1 Tax=Pseudochloris wilhelmii TaxID=1418016 RepID=A0A097KQU4_9CHLO|nr:hypothetical chloroplast RF47 [Pseudochloris wilhelmii]AIT95549.1 hypothetical chloroplast RF47 [Pseudochloris wilhelmii]